MINFGNFFEILVKMSPIFFTFLLPSSNISLQKNQFLYYVLVFVDIPQSMKLDGSFVN